MCKISVILCTYNSSINKIYQSLYSVLRQNMKDYEIIIADDGSENNNASRIENFFRQNSFSRYKLLLHKENVGTVLNLYDAVQKAEGEYIFGIGPGDFVYNRNVFDSLYEFAKNQADDFIIGDLVFYSRANGKIKLYKRFAPNLPEVFNLCNDLYFVPRLLIFYQNNPVGVTYFRKRETFQHYLREIAGKVVYQEDKSTTLLYLFDSNRIRYYKQPIVWYEFGTGISTSGDKNWEKRLDKDELVFKKIITKKNPKSRILNAIYAERGLRRLKYTDIYIVLYIWKAYIKLRGFVTGVRYSDKKELLALCKISHLK